jgi:hypothetical protein
MQSLKVCRTAGRAVDCSQLGITTEQLGCLSLLPFIVRATAALSETLRPASRGNFLTNSRLLFLFDCEHSAPHRHLLSCLLLLFTSASPIVQERYVRPRTWESAQSPYAEGSTPAIITRSTWSLPNPHPEPRLVYSRAKIFDLQL